MRGITDARLRRCEKLAYIRVELRDVKAVATPARYPACLSPNPLRSLLSMRAMVAS